MRCDTIVIMVAIVLAVTISQLSIKCDSLCRTFPDNLFTGGEWGEKEKTCKCYDTFSMQELSSIMVMPQEIRKSGVKQEESVFW